MSTRLNSHSDSNSNSYVLDTPSEQDIESDTSIESNLDSSSVNYGSASTSEEEPAGSSQSMGKKQGEREREGSGRGSGRGRGRGRGRGNMRGRGRVGGQQQAVQIPPSEAADITIPESHAPDNPAFSPARAAGPHLPPVQIFLHWTCFSYILMRP